MIDPRWHALEAAALDAVELLSEPLIERAVRATRHGGFARAVRARLLAALDAIQDARDDGDAL